MFLPLDFLTGSLGITVGGITGAENGNEFMIFWGMLVAVVMLPIIIFKKLTWI
ncbi:MAG: Mg2+ and Co2+ transporter CorA [Candidatus Pelagisphaera sp.]|jgi:Mg2+ and Co2+ transporter CorA